MLRKNLGLGVGLSVMSLAVLVEFYRFVTGAEKAEFSAISSSGGIIPSDLISTFPPGLFDFFGSVEHPGVGPGVTVIKIGAHKHKEGQLAVTFTFLLPKDVMLGPGVENKLQEEKGGFPVNIQYIDDGRRLLLSVD